MSKSSDFLDVVKTTFVESPVPNSWWVRSGYIVVKARGKDKVELSGIWVSPSQRGQGEGGVMLEFVTNLADLHGVTLLTWASPYGPGSKIKKKHLEAWYQRNGFEPFVYRGKQYLKRDPR